MKAEELVERLNGTGAIAFARMGADMLDRRAEISLSVAESVPSIVHSDRQEAWREFYTAESNEYRRCVDGILACAEAASLILTQQEAIERLREALEPFARDFKLAGVSRSFPDSANWDDVDCCRGTLTLADFRKARSTLDTLGVGR